MDRRDEFLIKMYEQLFNDIDRHHKIVWQVVGLLITSFALLSLVEKKIVPIDIAVSVVTVISLWVITHVYDSNYWYNRNLVIIANIERQFLKQSDLKDIQYYFGEHRATNAIQTSLKIQLYLSWGIICLFLIYHFFVSILPGFSIKFNEAEIVWVKTLPYFSVFTFYFILVRRIRNKRRKDYQEFISNSPGIQIDTTGINYGSGHPTN